MTLGLVAAGVYLLTGSDYTALLFGALASATAPAATADVLAEYRAEGPLTRSLVRKLAGTGLSSGAKEFGFGAAFSVGNWVRVQRQSIE